MPAGATGEDGGSKPRRGRALDPRVGLTRVPGERRGRLGGQMPPPRRGSEKLGWEPQGSLSQRRAQKGSVRRHRWLEVTPGTAGRARGE